MKTKTILTYKLSFLAILLIGLNFYAKKIHINFEHSRQIFTLIIAIIVFFDFKLNGSIFGILELTKHEIIKPTKEFFNKIDWIIIIILSCLMFLSEHGQNGNMGYDQQMYINEAKALAHFNLNFETYRYPLGYPLLGVPFFFLKNPFFLPNFAMFLIIIIYTMKTFELLALPKSFNILGLLFLLFHSPFTHMIAYPWTTTVTVTSFSYLTYLCIKKPKITHLRALSIAFAVGYPFFARYLDGFLLLPQILYLFYIHLTDKRENVFYKINNFSICLFILVLIACSIFIANHKIFGSPFKNAYTEMYNEESKSEPVFNFKKIPYNLLGSFYSPVTVNPNSEKGLAEKNVRPYFASAPILFFSIIGFFIIFYLFKEISLIILASLLLDLLLYGSYFFSDPRFLFLDNLRFFIILIPISVFFSMYALYYLKYLSFNKRTITYLIFSFMVTIFLPFILKLFIFS